VIPCDRSAKDDAETPAIPKRCVAGTGARAKLVLTPIQHLVLLWGRVRRFLLNTLRPGYVETRLAQRHGACRRCGACCQLGSRCGDLHFAEGLAACACYGDGRPLNCRTFPITATDLADRDLILPEQPCGYFWVAQEAEDLAAVPDGAVWPPAVAPPVLVAEGAGTPKVAVASAQVVVSPAATGRVHGRGSNQSVAESAR
jgi:hypothetical protein